MMKDYMEKLDKGLETMAGKAPFDLFTINKVNKYTQELIQSDSHQVLNIKGKDRQIQLNNHKKKKKKKKKKKMASALRKQTYSNILKNLSPKK